jgi:hypothetical protein
MKGADRKEEEDSQQLSQTRKAEGNAYRYRGAADSWLTKPLKRCFLIWVSEQ